MRVLLNVLHHFIDPFVKLVTKLGELLLVEFSHRPDGALPLLLLIILVQLLVYRHLEQELILAVYLVEVAGVVAEDLQLCARGVDLCTLRHLVKSVAHNGDEHVEHSYLGEGRCEIK